MREPGHATGVVAPPPRGRASTPTVQLRAIRSMPCPHCARAIDRDVPFCLHCGLRVIGELRSSSIPAACDGCGAARTRHDARFCGSCGASFPNENLRSEVRTAPRGVQSVREGAHLALINDSGEVMDVLQTPNEFGGGGDGVRVAPLPRCNSMFVFVHDRQPLDDGDVLLIGAQRVRFRLLDHGSHARPLHINASEAIADVAVLEQLRADDSVRDTLHLTRGRCVLIGRESGDWVFPYDATVSARHCELIPSTHAADVRGAWVLRDLGSRNGTGVAVRSPRKLRTGERLLMGGQMMRVEKS